ncbi:MAG: hypothetical protein QGG09_14115 [Pirellulaceae bacterium]|nr:hypothetical protein [Pirellulaceae bacterium]HJN10079.1 hypothetical protein [Pirellulaceae bacterium]
MVLGYEVEQQDEQRGRKTGKSDIHGVIVSLEWRVDSHMMGIVTSTIPVSE